MTQKIKTIRQLEHEQPVIDEEVFSKGYEYLRRVLDYVLGHSAEAKILIYLYPTAREYMQISEATDIPNGNLSRYLKRLSARNYVGKYRIYKHHYLYFLTTLGDTIALGYMSLVKVLQSHGKLEQLLPGESEQAKMALKVIEEMTSIQKRAKEMPPEPPLAPDLIRKGIDF